MFATKPGLFSIGTIVVLTSTCLNLVKQVIKPMFESPISFDILAKLVPFTTCQDSYTPWYFPTTFIKDFFQPKVGKMEIDKTPAWIKVQSLHITRWTITKEEQLTKINLGSKENL
jgi:hypothetical protein